MIRQARVVLLWLTGLVMVVGLGVALTMVLSGNGGSIPGFDDSETIEFNQYNKPPDADALLVDDRIEDKKTSFDPALVDRRPLEGWSLNGSEAIIRLDVPLTRPDQNPEHLVLHPSYASAVKGTSGLVLPSVNMIDGKAKQFDDGLYAAIDQAYYLGHGAAMKSHIQTLRRIFDKVTPGSPAADLLAAGLSLSGEPVAATSPRAKALAAAFLSREVLSKPIGFYSWTKPLSECFRVLRFFSRPIQDPAAILEITRVLRDDPALLADYRKASQFYARLTNPLVGRTPADLVDGPSLKPNEEISLFPPSTSRETELFDKLFPRGLPLGADLMRELITAIRSGRVDLKPQVSGGWYDHQVYALETLLLPEKGAEAQKLLLTKSYKKRMLEAFEALITKRRETHARGLKSAVTSEIRSRDLDSVKPRLRVEPNPTYYLRTARSYAFLANFLEATLGESPLAELQGLREGGERAMNLQAELKRMTSLFYGLALLSAEDIGMKLAMLEGEEVDVEACETVATQWLAKIAADPDLAADTRVSVPVFSDPQTGQVRLWATLGVRITPLVAQYVTAPRVRPLDGSGDWKPVERYKLEASEYLIAVDEFAEVEVQGGRVYTRAELREVCDRMKTRAKIVEALQK